MDLDAPILGLICSYMKIQEIVQRVSVLNKRVHRTMIEDKEESEAVWKSIMVNWRAESQGVRGTLRVDAAMYKQIADLKALQNAKWVKEITMLQREISGPKVEHMEIEGVEASSQDHDQSIYRTLDRKSLDFFWSSTGSESSLANEWLIYKVS